MTLDCPEEQREQGRATVATTPDPASEGPGEAPGSLHIDVASPEATTALASRLGQRVSPGDTILLSGTLGAGKSHFARALIRAALDAPDLAVPSPSYTLVNVYQMPDQSFEVWHADLYRLGDAEDLLEIGLDDAAGDAILLVEWPELWVDRPDRHLAVRFEVTGDTERRLIFEAHGTGWDHLMEGVQ